MKGPTMPTMRSSWLIALALFAIPDLAHADSQVPLWKDGQPKCSVVLPDSDPPSARIAKATLNRFLGEFYKFKLPVGEKADVPATYIVVGNPVNNRLLRQLTQGDVHLTTRDIG